MTDACKRAAERTVELGGELEDGALIVYLQRPHTRLEPLDRLVRDLQKTAAVLDAA